MRASLCAVAVIAWGLPLIELQYGGLGKNLREQQTLCRGKVDQAEAFPVPSNTVSITCL
jgi:hypothetical protein